MVGVVGVVAVLLAGVLACGGDDATPPEIAGELVGDVSFVYDDLGGNACGCGEDAAPCKAVSAGLVPPEPISESL